MIRAKKVYFRTSKADEDRLFACNRESARVWNECLQLAKNYYLNYQKWISKSELQKQTKGKFHLHSQSIQAVCHKYLFARNSAHQTIKKGHTTTRYPYKKKNHYNTKWAKNGFKMYPHGKIKEIELCYDNGLYLAVSFEDGQKNKAYQSGQAVGVDMGEIHTLAAFCEKGQALIVTGRKIRSLHRLRNKKLAEIQRLQSKCKKGSRQWRKYGRAKRYVLSKSEKQLQDALHKATHNFVEWCIKQSVSDVYIGNPEGVQRNTRKKKKTNRKQAQKLSNWSFGQVKEYLKYKVVQEGIKMHEVNEAYTSQTCPVCKKKKKVSSRNYVCSCGYQEHRDVHGARNILSKAIHEEIRHFDVPTKQKYLRIA